MDIAIAMKCYLKLKERLSTENPTRLDFAMMGFSLDPETMAKIQSLLEEDDEGYRVVSVDRSSIAVERVGSGVENR